MGTWFTENWFNILSAVGVIASLLFTAISFRSETETRRIANLLTVTANHRDLWKEVFHRPQLARVLVPDVDLIEHPVAADERIFVNMVILHLSSIFETIKGELITKQQGVRQDVAVFFSLPIPKTVWQQTKLLQNDDFVAFVEQSIRQAEL